MERLSKVQQIVEKLGSLEKELALIDFNSDRSIEIGKEMDQLRIVLQEEMNDINPRQI